MGGKVTSQRPADCRMFKVCDLMDTRQRCWNPLVVRQYFQPQEAEFILQVPIDPRGDEDRLMWDKEKK